MTSDKALEILRRFAARRRVIYVNGTAVEADPDEIDEALDLAVSALERDRWISVEDRYPENNRFVLACNDEGRMGIAQYVGYDGITPWQIAYCLYDVDQWDDEEQGPVCYWRELPPEPPKEDKP